jgi:hypothetical protein
MKKLTKGKTYTREAILKRGLEEKAFGVALCHTMGLRVLQGKEEMYVAELKREQNEIYYHILDEFYYPYKRFKVK